MAWERHNLVMSQAHSGPASLAAPASSTHKLAAPFSSLALNGSLHEPLWRQLFLQINQMLSDGTLAEGMSLPTERDLALALNVSRITVKRCYDELRWRNLLGGRGRAGTVVQKRALVRAQPTLGKLKGFTEEMRELGMQPSTRLLRRLHVQNRHVASIFGRPSGTPLLHVARIRLGNGTPMSRELAWYDLSAAPALAQWDGEGSAYAWLREHCKLELTHAEQTVEAIFSAEEESEAFGFATPQPCLLLKRRTYAGNTSVPLLIEYVEGTFRGDAYVYRAQLTV